MQTKKTITNNQILTKLVLDSCLRFGRDPKLNQQQTNFYIFGTRAKLDIFKLYEIRYLLLKVYPLIHNLFLQARFQEQSQPYVRNPQLEPDRLMARLTWLKKGKFSGDVAKQMQKNLNQSLSRRSKPCLPRILFATTTPEYRDIVSSAARKCYMPFHTDYGLCGAITAGSFFQTSEEEGFYFQNRTLEENYQEKIFKQRKTRSQQLAHTTAHQKSRKFSLLILPDVSNNDMILRETNVLDIPVIGLVNSHCKYHIPYPIFANDASVYSVYFFCHFLSALITKEIVKTKHKFANLRTNQIRHSLSRTLKEMSQQARFRKQTCQQIKFQAQKKGKKKQRFLLKKNRAFQKKSPGIFEKKKPLKKKKTETSYVFPGKFFFDGYVKPRYYQVTADWLKSYPYLKKNPEETFAANYLVKRFKAVTRARRKTGGFTIYTQGEKSQEKLRAKKREKARAEAKRKKAAHKAQIKEIMRELLKKKHGTEGKKYYADLGKTIFEKYFQPKYEAKLKADIKREKEEDRLGELQKVKNKKKNKKTFKLAKGKAMLKAKAKEKLILHRKNQQRSIWFYPAHERIHGFKRRAQAKKIYKLLQELPAVKKAVKNRGSYLDGKTGKRIKNSSKAAEAKAIKNLKGTHPTQLETLAPQIKDIKFDTMINSPLDQTLRDENGEFLRKNSLQEKMDRISKLGKMSFSQMKSQILSPERLPKGHFGKLNPQFHFNVPLTSTYKSRIGYRLKRILARTITAEEEEKKEYQIEAEWMKFRADRFAMIRRKKPKPQKQRKRRKQVWLPPHLHHQRKIRQAQERKDLERLKVKIAREKYNRKHQKPVPVDVLKMPSVRKYLEKHGGMPKKAPWLYRKKGPTKNFRRK